MIRISYPLIAGVLCISLASCSSLNEEISENQPSKIYTLAQKKLKSGNWKQAIKQLEGLNNFYPFDTYSKKGQLDLIYAYYKNSDLMLAKTTIDRLIRLNPIHPNIDYVIYMRGLINMALDSSALHRFFGIDHSDRDPQYANEAFNDFSELVCKYPNSKYLKNATKHLLALKDRLAKYEYSVAAYYTRRNAWIAVVNRVEDILYNYPGAQVTQKSLKLMENAYRQMKINIQADKVRKIIQEY